MRAHLLLANFLLAAFCSVSCFAFQQDERPPAQRPRSELPGESVLPGQVLKALPGEARLPGESKGIAPSPSGDAAATETGIDGSSAQTVPPPHSLPPENDLPTARSVVIAPTDVLPATPLNGDEAGESLVFEQNHPWLRLNVGGPTAPLKVLKFTSDSGNLLAGGDDKALHVWSLVEDSTNRKIWVYKNPVLWQVQRGPRGAIKSIGVGANQIAFGGIGASVMTGEVSLISPADFRFQGSLYDVQAGPRAEISSLVVDESGRVSSIDVEGRVVTWNRDEATGQWKLSTLRKGDYESYDSPIAALLTGFRLSGNALAATQRGELVYPELAAPFAAGDPYPQWNLVRRSPDKEAVQVLPAAETHKGSVTAIAVSRDGMRIASADLTRAGWVFLWDLANRPNAVTFQMNAQVRTISISPSGRLLMVGTARAGEAEDGPARVSVWQWGADGKFNLLASWKHEDDILAGQISPDENWIAYTTGNSIEVRALNALDEGATVLHGNVVQPVNAAFSANVNDDYRILVSSRDDAGTATSLIFDTQHPRIADVDPASNDTWVKNNPFPQRWQLAMDDDDRGHVTTFVSIDGQRKGQIPVDINLDGSITCASWIADPQKPDLPSAVIVGTSKRNHLFVFRVSESGLCPLLRQFRGHVAPLVSVGVSRDHRYLLSSSLDGTVRIWKLQDALSENTGLLENRWGAEFQIENDALVVKSLVTDGPLYFRGVRTGDVISKLSWNSGQGTVETQEIPQKMLDALAGGDWRRMYGFQFSRREDPQPGFYLYPAWQPIVSLVIAADREWAYWTPYGYYDASFNGHKMFGWQVNRGIDNPPEFFRASEMKNELERPQLMEKLLALGSIQDAFLSRNGDVPANIQDRVAAENRLRPRVEIRAPLANTHVEGGETRIEAVIELPSGIELVHPKAFANGVPAVNMRLESSSDDGSNVRSVFSWTAKLPNEQNLRIQVFAASEYGSAALDEVDITHQVSTETLTPRLFLIGAGINDYADRQIPQLEFAINNVTAIKDVITSPQNRLYQSEAALLTDKSVNRSLWAVAAGSFLDRLRREARPDDLLVVFLSGHGFRDPDSEQYFYLTSTTRHADLLGRRYADCISLEDFGKFSEIPCRKIVILDTCHSGAVQALTQSNLKAIVRALENDLIFTLTASEGTEEAFESTEQQMSFFSATLLQALQGSADEKGNGGNEDGRVEFSEVVRYVKNTVPSQISRMGRRQYPTAAPKELVEIVTMPITAVALPK